MVRPDDTSPPHGTTSVVVFGVTGAESETVHRALVRHDLEVAVEHDVAETLDRLGTGDFECLVALDDAVDASRLYEELRQRDSLFPVVFLLDSPEDDLLERLDTDETAEYVSGDVNSVSYDRLADRIRTTVAAYRTTHAQRSERDVVQRLEDRLHRTEQKITALHSVAMDLNASTSAEDVYRETVTAAEEILDLDICFAFTAEEEQFVPMARSSTPTDRDLEPVPLDAGVMGETYRTGTSERAVDMELHALAAPEFGDYRSGISAPIGEFGVFQAVSKQAGAFDEIDLELTELLTAHAASVLQRLEFESQLRVERDRYAALFDNSQDCIIVAEFVDGDTIVESVNPAFERVFGYAEADVVGESIDDIVVSEERREEARSLTRQVRRGEFVQAEVRRRAKDGLKDFLLRSVPMDDDTLYAVYTDITDQKKTERTIERKNERLDTFASTVSHDLRNPLSVAQGHLDLVREERDDDRLDTVARAHDRIRSLTEDLLVLAREGERALSIRPVELAAAVERTWDGIETEEASIVVDCEATIRADEGQLRQLLGNLVRNAVEHAGADSTIWIGELEDGFYVEDDGPGIPEADREQVFDAGYSTATEGTGFGLNIVEQVATAHDWNVSVSDGREGGARFEIRDVEFQE